MRPRQDLIEVFAAFIEFQGDRFSRWVTDPKLRRSMQHRLEQISDAHLSDNSWVLYWHNLWKLEPKSIAAGHLNAYLQEPCYWAAQKMMTALGASQLKQSDCFQIAIADVDKVLSNYDPQRGASLRSYAQMVFPTLIRDTLRQRQEADICTDWTLLRRLSKKLLRESLHYAGLSAESIERYQLAWVCFKAVHAPTQPAEAHTLSQPDSNRWEAIATLYNTERLHQLITPGPSCNAATLEQWLKNCARWARSYLYPPVSSLNRPRFEGETGEWQDDLPDTQTDSLLASLIDQEEIRQRQEQQAQLNAALIDALHHLDPEAQSLLDLYYWQGLTQQQIAQKLEIKQYAVSRQLTRAREALLTALVQWSQETLHISITPNLIKTMSVALEEWLRIHNDEPDRSPVLAME